MNKFDKIMESVLKEDSSEESANKTSELYREVSDILVKKGLMAYEIHTVNDVVRRAYMQGYMEGRKAAESNPFK